MALGLKALTLAAALLALSGGGGQTQETEAICQHDARIVEIAERILDRRMQLTAEEAGEVGSQAAYLWLKHSGASGEEGLAFLRDLGDRMETPFFSFDTLESVFTIARVGSKMTPRYFATEADFVEHGALLRLGNGEPFFERLATVRAHERLARLWARISPISRVHIALAVNDLDDAALLARATRAEKMGALAIAGGLLAVRHDLDAFLAFIERHAGAEDDYYFSPDYLAPRGFFFPKHLMPPLQLFPERNQDDWGQILVAHAARAGAVDLVFWPPGDEVAYTALRYLDGVSAGQIDPGADHETNWLAAFEIYAKVVGTDEAQQVARRGKTRSSSGRHFGWSGPEALDWFLTKRALGPFVREETDQPPARPDGMAAEFDWDTWLRLAEAVRGGAADPDPDSERTRRILIELHALREDLESVLALSDGFAEPLHRVHVLQDFLGRLRLECTGRPIRGVYVF